MRRVVRRRHRTWMLSMTLATLGWGTWWLAVVLWELAPAVAPSLELTLGLSSSFALVGCLAWLLTLRAKLAWVLITAVPLFANGSLLVLLAFREDLRAVAAVFIEEVEHPADAPDGD